MTFTFKIYFDIKGLTFKLKTCPQFQWSNIRLWFSTPIRNFHHYPLKPSSNYSICPARVSWIRMLDHPKAFSTLIWRWMLFAIVASAMVLQIIELKVLYVHWIGCFLIFYGSFMKHTQLKSLARWNRVGLKIHECSCFKCDRVLFNPPKIEPFHTINANFLTLSSLLFYCLLGYYSLFHLFSYPPYNKGFTKKEP